MKVGWMLKPMLLTQADEIPKGEEWIYETKYDGFRCLVEWGEEPILISRNGKVLNPHFPEIIYFLTGIKERIRPFLPIRLDGELVFLTNNFQSDFSVVQLRGRLRSQNSIKKHSMDLPCQLVVFDLLQLKGEDVRNLPLIERKDELQKLFNKVNLPLSVNQEDPNCLQMIDVFHQHKKLWNKVMTNNGEGIIAKRKNSNWMSNTRTTNWLKIKNWRYVTVILTKFDKGNSYFNGSVYKENVLIDVVSFRHGLKVDEYQTLVKLFETNGKKIKKEVWELQPSICVEIACIDFHGGMLREPRFHAFKFQIEPEDCQWNKMLHQLLPIPKSVPITHPEKPVFSTKGIRKEDYIYYLQNVASVMLPFLRNRPLTLIRYPHGVPGESFYQKSSPDHVPDFVTTTLVEETQYIVCNNLETLLWLGNQLAIEFHIPFQPIQTDQPTEIVFDLDPPSVDEFSLAVEAALRMKAIFDQLNIQSFAKTSGGKGMQLYIPLPFEAFSYGETGLFTKFVCEFLIEQYPQWFTIERLKKNRHHKLYLDYVQYREGKTIIAPYSTRGNDNGLVATPLLWDEVNDSLKPSMFTITAVEERLKNRVNPFSTFREARVVNGKSLSIVLEQLQQLKEK